MATKLTTRVHFSTLSNGAVVIRSRIDKASDLRRRGHADAIVELRQAATDCEALQRQLLLKAAELENNDGK